MNSSTKIILGIIAGIVVLCLLVGVAGALLLRSTGRTVRNIMENGASSVDPVSESIADYTLPEGFGDGFATNFADFSMVSYTGDDGHSHIYLFQLPSYVNIDMAELERQAQQATGNGDQDWVKTEVVDTQPVTIDGQATELVISEGVNHDNRPYRQVSAVFEAQGSQTVVVFSGPVSTWDQANVDAFLASIHSN